MRSLFTKAGLFVFLSALLCALGVMFTQFYIAWVALIPLFIAIHNQKSKKSFWSGALFGIVFCAVLLYWMIALVSDFAGKGIYGIVFYLVALLLSAGYFGLVTMSISWLTEGKKPLWLKALVTASVWTFGEWAYSAALPGMPWFGLFRVSNMVLNNLYAIQISAIGGAFLISYFIVIVNYVAAHYIAVKKMKMLIMPAGIVLAYILTGYFMLNSFKEKYSRSGKSIVVAILCDNTPPDVKWNENNGSQLVKKLLDLNQSALAVKPDIELWSESVVPWTYRSDDDFIKEVLSRTAAGNVTHIIGMTTDYTTTEIYNSAYAILPDGKVAGRYDKRFPVSMAEQPIAFISLPFSGSNNRQFEKTGESTMPLPTPQGKAGVLICNDGTVPGATTNMARNGAQFLVSVSNDAWFSHIGFLVDQHFYNTRLRAVEVRKDLAINCNMGSSGLVSATGELDVKSPEVNSSVLKVDLYGNKVLTLYATVPMLLTYVNMVFILIFILLNIVHYFKAKT